MRAASTFNLGGYETMPSQTPVVKLEVVVQTDAYVKAETHEPQNRGDLAGAAISAAST